MGALPSILGLLTGAVIIYFIQRKYRGKAPEPDTDSTRSAEETLATIPKQNDRLVLVKKVSFTDLRKVLIGFCNMYNKENYQALLRLTKISENEFAITFPYDINFEIFCYLINYISYPMELKWTADITGWTTIKPGDKWMSDKIPNKKIMVFIPPDDNEYDNVYVTTSENMGYKIPFSLSRKNKLQTTPSKFFVSPNVDVTSLDGDFEDFK